MAESVIVGVRVRPFFTHDGGKEKSENTLCVDMPTAT